MSQDQTQRHAGKTLAVIGAGPMGSGITQVAAQAGWQVVMADVTEEALARAIAGNANSMSRFVAAGHGFYPHEA